jgi:Response regulator containing CheY-like receiver domain and AraC-type DNA-binding domain
MSRTIVIADDSLVISRQLAKVVEGFGEYQVVGQAKNGAEAIKLFQSLKPDAVLMDINMPLMDGLQSLRTILRLDAKARVVMISSLGGVGDKVQEAMKLGARNVISKPFEPDRIRTVLESLFTQG